MAENRPKLTYVIQHFDQTGPMRAPYLICKAFVQAGWDVEILTLAEPHNLAMDLVWGGVPVRKVAGPNKRIAMLRLLISLARRRRDHLILSDVWRWHVYGLLLARWFFASPYVLALDAYVHRSGATRRARLSEALRYGPQLCSASLILAECPRSRAAAERYTKRPFVAQVPCCLWQRDLAEIEAKWAAEGFAPERENVILYAGRLIERKGVHDLIVAFARLAAAFPDWRLEIRGLAASAAYQKRLEELIAQLAMTARVQLLPGLEGEQLYRRYRETAVFTLPSSGEGIPTTIIEAMYFGGAIVAGISGAIPHQLDEGRCGLLHQPGDVDALTSHLQSFMASAETRQRYMAQARERMLALFVWERYFPELETLFRQALTR